MGAVRSSEISVNLDRTTQHQISEERTLHSQAEVFSSSAYRVQRELGKTRGPHSFYTYIIIPQIPDT
jgi:hypothetical protein